MLEDLAEEYGIKNIGERGLIELTGGYKYHENSCDFVCDDRYLVDNVRVIQSLSDEEFEKLLSEIKALEELYEPHFLSGVMAQNTPAARTTEQVWIKNGKYAK